MYHVLLLLSDPLHLVCIPPQILRVDDFESQDTDLLICVFAQAGLGMSGKVLTTDMVNVLSKRQCFNDAFLVMACVLLLQPY